MLRRTYLSERPILGGRQQGVILPRVSDAARRNTQRLEHFVRALLQWQQHPPPPQPRQHDDDDDDDDDNDNGDEDDDDDDDDDKNNNNNNNNNTTSTWLVKIKQRACRPVLRGRVSAPSSVHVCSQPATRDAPARK